MEQARESGCAFCDIVAGEKPASVVYRDQRCWAFMDIRPVNPGHVLVIPVRHVAGLAQLDAEDGAQLFRVAQMVAQALRKSGVRCEGVNLHLADGRAAGQEIFHVHLHVVPRYRGDGFGLRFGPEYGRMPARAELDAQAAALKAHLHTGR